VIKFVQFLKMSERLKKFLPLLKKLKKIGPKGRKKLLKNAEDDLVICLCEMSHNTLNETIPVSAGQLKKLLQHKNILRKLIDKNIPVKKKKSAIIRQKGGFILPLLAPILGAIVQGIIFK
jgi:hypothetical protein